MKCGLDKTTCMARQGDQCLEHMFTDTPSCKSRVPATNFDRLRAMSDEELAKFLNDKDCPPTACRVTNGIAIHSECETCWLEWGRSPYKEESHE